MKKRAVRIMLAVMLAGTMTVTPVYAEPGSVSSLQQEKAAADSEVSALQGELMQLITEVDQLEADMNQKGAEVTQAALDLEAAQEKEQKQYKDMKLRIKYMYEEGDTNFLQKLLTAESISDLLNQADYIQKVHSYDRDMLEQYIETKQEVASLKEKKEEELEELHRKEQEYEAHKADANARLQEAEARSADFGEKLQAAIEAEAEKRRQEEAEKAAREKAEQDKASTQQNQGSNQNAGGSGNVTVSGGQDISAPEEQEDSYTPPASNGSGQAVANYACNFIGNPYVWGGESLTHGCDCSGFVMSVYAHFGYGLPHSSGALRGVGRGVSYSQAQPGDILCYAGHVGIYIGGGQMVNAIDDAHGIGISSATYAPILAVRRMF